MHEHIDKMIKNNPNRVIEIIKELSQEYGDEILDYFNCHIKNEENYNDFVKYFVNFDKTKGPHWNLQTIKNKTNINFSNKDYTLFDYAYTVNMRYSDDGDLMSIDNIFASAQRYLEDDDYYGDPSERAYIDAKQRKEFFN